MAQPQKTARSLTQSNTVKKSVVKTMAGTSLHQAQVIPPTYQSVCIGSVQVKVEVPTTAEVQKRLKESQAVVKGIGRALNKHGVKLDLKATTATFSSDPKQPHLVIRKLGKIVTRGEFKNGKFVEVA